LSDLTALAFSRVRAFAHAAGSTWRTWPAASLDIGTSDVDA